jgi:Fe-S-cluster containining protein
MGIRSRIKSLIDPWRKGSAVEVDNSRFALDWQNCSEIHIAPFFDSIRIKFEVRSSEEGGVDVARIVERHYDFSKHPALKGAVSQLWKAIVPMVASSSPPSVLYDEKDIPCNDCTHCNCCRGIEEGIPVTETERKRIVKHLRETGRENLISRAFGRIADGGHWSGEFLYRMLQVEDEVEPDEEDHCIFLNTSVQPNRCTIYEVRPRPCRLWEANGCLDYDGPRVSEEDMEAAHEILDWE